MNVIPSECCFKRGEGEIIEVRQDPQGTGKHMLGVQKREVVILEACERLTEEATNTEYDLCVTICAGFYGVYGVGWWSAG